MGTKFVFSIILVLGVGCSHIERRQQMQNAEVEHDNGNDSPTFYKNKIREMEKGLVTRQDKALYSKLLPWFQTDEEKLSFLRNSDYEDKQKWVIKTKILNRPTEFASRYKPLIDSQDISIGMPNEIVKKSWGDPVAVESSGNSLFKNEKWRYARTVSTPEGFKQEKRVVYFEGGRVVGWETE